jgi:hypothetical protein
MNLDICIARSARVFARELRAKKTVQLRLFCLVLLELLDQKINGIWTKIKDNTIVLKISEDPLHVGYVFSRFPP